MQWKMLRGAVFAGGWAVFCVPTFAADCASLKAADADSNGKLEKVEVKKAASEAWKRITAMRNKGEEFEARLGSKELAEGTAGAGVTEKEYIEIASVMFSAADADKEGSVDCTELESETGQNLTKLLK